MMRIPCPMCGARDEHEFAFGGEAHVSRPELGCTDEEWEAYLFSRSNIKGTSYERWQHRRGCRIWFHLVRDTVSHRIIEVYPIDEVRP